MLFAAFTQDLDPLNYRLASTLVAALPVLVLFFLLVARRWIASAAGAAGAVIAVLLAWLVFKMPIEMAGMSFVHGAIFGLLPIGWTVFAAMLLYNLTVHTGQFEIIRRSIGGLSGDARIQSVMIGFAFGAFMEGAAGAGSPVAICGAMLVGLGVPPFQAAVICLIANTSPVCYGGLGVPTLTLASTTGISADTLSHMAGHQLPLLSLFIPLYMVKCICSWKDTLAVLPALIVGGFSFAFFQYTFATFHVWVPGVVLWPLTDIGGGLFSLVTLALFLKYVWKPKEEWRFPGVAPQVDHPDAIKLTPFTILKAWSPFLLMALCLVGAGVLRQFEKVKVDGKDKDQAVEMGPLKSFYVIDVPYLHNEVIRAERLRAIDPKTGLVKTADESREAAQIKITWATAPGTPVFLGALLSALFLRVRPAFLWQILKKTLIQMKVPIPTIACMLGLSYVTKYAGMDATLGVAFAGTGVLYPFFAAILGWLGVFLTGTDAGSNALFGSLQKITATEVWNNHHTGAMSNLTLEQSQTLICSANSTGGVMGKMIDAQSICVATAGTNQVGKEADIFKAVIWHSIVLASIVGLLIVLQAYLPPFTNMVPK